MDQSADRRPPAPELAAYADQVASRVRQAGADWAWRRARLVARDRWVGFAEDVVFELPDGCEVRPPVGRYGLGRCWTSCSGGTPRSGLGPSW